MKNLCKWLFFWPHSWTNWEDYTKLTWRRIEDDSIKKEGISQKRTCTKCGKCSTRVEIIA